MSWLRTHCPLLAKIARTTKKSSLENLTQGREVWFCQMERDIALLARKIPFERLVSAYRRHLGSIQEIFPGLFYELYVGARLVNISDTLELQIPTSDGGRLYDFRISIGSESVNIEVKAKEDRFPFNLQGTEIVKGLKVYGGSRAGADLRGLSEEELKTFQNVQEDVDRPTPHSTEIRQRLEEAIVQLPEDEPGFIVLGHPRGDLWDTINALLGDEVIEMGRGKTKEGKRVRFNRHSRLNNGVFSLGSFSKVCGVIWLRLDKDFGVIKRKSHIIWNPKSKFIVSQNLQERLLRAFDRSETLKRELDRIIAIVKDSLRPEQIILFGSLASNGDALHEASDLDLAIVTQTELPVRERIRQILSLVKPRVDVNVLVYTPEEYERLKITSPFVRKEIAQKGKVIYP